MVVKDLTIFRSLKFGGTSGQSANQNHCDGTLLANDQRIQWHSDASSIAEHSLRERLEGFNGTGPPLVVILRGLPGSGKSTLCSMICAADKETKVCSADNFFAAGAGVLRRRELKGLTDREVYQKCWSREL